MVLENQDYSSILGSPAMPYLNSLASQYGLATSYFANTHPSIGNYFMLTTGQIITNQTYFTGVVSEDNVVRRLTAAGKTWKAYAESLPAVGYLGPQRPPYVKHHNPFAYFSDVVNNAEQQANVVPFAPHFAADLAANRLPTYSFIVPNQYNNSHDCLDGRPNTCPLEEKLARADTWLRNNIAPLIAHPIFQREGLLLITFDEAHSDNANGGGRIVTVVVSEKAKRGFRSATFFQHQSALRLKLEALALPPQLGAAANAASMYEFFSADR